MTPDFRQIHRTVRPDSARRYSPQRWADRLVSSLDPATLEWLYRDPKDATVNCFRLSLREATALGERRGAGGWCDGLSFTEEGEVLYAPTPFSRRDNFTIAHEIGHHLTDADEDDDLWDWLGDLPERGAFIERTCDAIASQLLLPRDRVRALLGKRRPSGGVLHELFASSEASREACAIAVAERIGCDGFTLLAKADTSTVTFASRFGETRLAPWRGDPLPTSHPLHNLRPTQTQARESWWPDSRNQRHRYYQHAFRDDNNWIYAIFAVNDLWNVARLHLPRAEPERLRLFQVNCSCSYRGTTTDFPCPVCRKPPCPRCGCDCDRKAKLPTGQCLHCFKTVRSHLIIDGLCDGCR
jgi:uncharacterized protein DUF955